MSNYKNSFFCFEKNKKYYALDVQRIIPMRIDKVTYELLSKIEGDKCPFEDIDAYRQFEGFSNLEILKKCDLLFHKIDKIYMNNSFQELNISLVPTLGCNLNCKYCYSKVKESNKEITIDVIEKAFHFFCNNYDFEICRVDFVSGGEPLMTQDRLIKVIDRIQDILGQYDKRSLMWLCTNGTLLNENILGFLDKNNINLGISLDGPLEVNDSNRAFKNGGGTYECISKNIKSLLDNPMLSRKTKYLWNSAVISAATNSLVEVLNNAYLLGFSNIQMKLVWSNNNQQRLTVNKAVELYEELTRYLFNLIKNKETSRFLMLCNENDTYGKILLRIIIQSGVTRRCNAGINKFSLSYDGKLYPCDSFLENEEYCIGDVVSGFNSKYYQIRQLGVESNDICRNCWARFLCGGDCFYHSLLNTGEIDMPDENNCMITKELIKMGVSLIVDLYEEAPSSMQMIYNVLSKRTKAMQTKNVVSVI